MQVIQQSGKNKNKTLVTMLGITIKIKKTHFGNPVEKQVYLNFTDSL